MHQQHILVPLDGSTFSETILPHAVALAHATHSALYLFRVLEPIYEPIYGALGISEKQEAEQLARLYEAQLASIHDYLSNIARQLRAEGLEVLTEVVEGINPAAQIVTRVEQGPSPLLIAMATHGRSGVLRWLFGSVVAEVVQAIQMPLLLFRPHQDTSPYSTVHPKAVTYQTVVVPLDGSSFAEHALEQAHLLALAMNVTLLLVSVLPPPNDETMQKDIESTSLLRALQQTETERRITYLEQKAEPLRRQGVVVQTHVTTGRPAEEILHFSTQHTLLVITIHGHVRLRRLFLGSVAMKIVQGAHGPVLLTRGNQSHVS
ncbi:MAG: universal stress protein [Ktedonobacteraceae bacterium]